MPSVPRSLPLRFVLAALVACALLAGCGKKGPLYLRDSPPPGVKPPKPKPYEPVPYPREAGEAEK
jgi:predicted small lipoprotein YifL